MSICMADLVLLNWHDVIREHAVHMCAPRIGWDVGIRPLSHSLASRAVNIRKQDHVAPVLSRASQMVEPHVQCVFEPRNRLIWACLAADISE